MIARAALSIRRGRALAPAAAPAAGRTRRSPGTSPAAATARAVAGGDRSTGTGSRTDHEPKHYFGCKRFRPGVSVTAIATLMATRNKGRERRGKGCKASLLGVLIKTVVLTARGGGGGASTGGTGSPPPPVPTGNAQRLCRDL